MIESKSHDHSISVEKFDDVAFEIGNRPVEMLQMKHHQNSKKSLSNASTDLWKTLRVWSSAILSGDVDLSETSFTIITTENASKGSAASKLRPSNRDEESALEMLLATVAESTNDSNKSAYKEFMKLPREIQVLLLRNITVLDSSPNIIDTKDRILINLQYATRPEHIEQFFQRLEGWWFQKIVDHLSSDFENVSSISKKELLDIISDLREQFTRENLPIDYPNPLAIDESELPTESRIFVEQLKLVAVHHNRIQKAISDYYRAYYQRSKWMREDLVGVEEIPSYETRLIDEWERLFYRMKEDLGDASAEKIKIKSGRDLFNKIEDELTVHIRKNCTEPYIMRGSYHILSNQKKIGWHTDFIKRLQEIMEKEFL